MCFPQLSFIINFFWRQLVFVHLNWFISSPCYSMFPSIKMTSNMSINCLKPMWREIYRGKYYSIGVCSEGTQKLTLLNPREIYIALQENFGKGNSHCSCIHWLMRAWMWHVSCGKWLMKSNLFSYPKLIYCRLHKS